MLDPTRFFFSSPFLFNPSNISAIVPTSPLFIGGTAANHQPTTATTSVITGVATKPTTSASSSSSFSIADILDNKIKNNNNTVGTDYNSGVAAYIKAIKDEDGDDDDGSSTPNSGGIGGGSMTTGGGKKPRKARTIFTDKQLQELETTFDKQKYLSVQDRMDLAHRMGLSDTQVKTWYQNRRTKWKRQTAVGMELLSEPTNFAVVQQLFRTNPYWTSYMAAHQQMQPSNYAAARGGGMWPIGGNETLSPANFGMLLPQQQQTSTAATSLTSSPKLSPPPSAS